MKWSGIPPLRDVDLHCKLTTITESTVINPYTNNDLKCSYQGYSLALVRCIPTWIVHSQEYLPEFFSREAYAPRLDGVFSS
jgi:hypothetical protein